MKTVLLAAFIAAICCTSFAGGEMPTVRSYRALEPPVTAQPQIQQKSGFFVGVKTYVVDRVNDVGDIFYSTVDAVVGVVKSDPDNDDGRTLTLW